ncbi:MFS general substrate transporter [Choiromyces venosus 120613-1]|uniref:MFS general substrate transporter n=1 Tax=Choiromyces venosus 120613-1 TaxID=1336337 RepID=A0A3N4JN18_9PEZI|nr:MFS general substrate transporter [Choiromyces venosus 120613-1]
MVVNATTPSSPTSIDSKPHGACHDIPIIVVDVADDSHLTRESFAHLDEKAILRKMDIRLIPMLALLYLLSFLDRGNIGNARIQGLVEDLGMTAGQYNWTLTIFFFSYCACEVPSNLLLKKFRPSIWLPSIMVAWGTVMTLMGIVKNYEGLLAARFWLGVTEAGLFPGVAYYITMWYCRHEAQLRQALFFSAASVAGAFSGLLAFAIAKMDGVGGYEGWRWIFILEGILTVVVAVVAFFTLYDFPETASFLTEEERRFVVWRLKYQGSIDMRSEALLVAKVAEDETFEWMYIWDAFCDWQIWVNIFVCWGIVCPLYGIALSLPSIIKSLGYSSAKAQLLTIPIYLTASLLAIIQAWYSDKKGIRHPFIFLGQCVACTGFIIAIATPKHLPGLVYAGVFIATCGIYPSSPGNITWLSSNLAGSYKRNSGMALQISCANLGGAMASNFYRARDAPRYTLGHALELGFIGVGIIALWTLVFGYKRINAKREMEGDKGLTPQEMSRLGDKSPAFKYTL